MAPVGPDTWNREPPKTAATAPATTAVVSPAAAPSPVEMPNPKASGRATSATIRPASRSAPGARSDELHSLHRGNRSRTDWAARPSEFCEAGVEFGAGVAVIRFLGTARRKWKPVWLLANISK